MKYGLIGEKLSHSFSARIHNRLSDCEYELKELTAFEVESFLRVRDFCGVNVTIPYKESVIPCLDVVDEAARSIGAVNTIVNRNGKLFGYNTDYLGLQALLAHNNITLSDRKVLILGSGGTSKTALAVAQAASCREVYRVSRAERGGCITYEQAARDHADAQIIINTTPCGMYPNIGDSVVNLDAYPALEGVVDVVYNPLRTQLVCDATARGIPAVGGLYMLVAQAAYASELFQCSEMSPDRVEEVYQQLTREKTNVVLVGMLSCGKSAVGKMLAKRLGRTFIDTDEEIVKHCGCSIPDVFKLMGESGFRDVESHIIRSISSLQGVVIATGGGTVLRTSTVELLKENGRLYFLDRSVEKLTATADRPLSSKREDLEKRYHERYAIYSTVSDVCVDGDGTADEVANLIREDFFHENIGR